MKAQNPVVVSAPQIFQKYVHVKGSLFSDSTLLSTDSTNRVPTTAWAKRLFASGGGLSTGVNGLNGTTNIGLGGTLSSNTTVAMGIQTLTFSGSGGTSILINPSATVPEISMINLVGVDGSWIDAKPGFMHFMTTKSSQHMGFTLDNSTGGGGGATYQDDWLQQGIKYLTDYSANFTARSLIDKGYGDTHYAGISAYSAGNGLTLTSGVFTLGGTLTASSTVLTVGSHSFSVIANNGTGQGAFTENSTTTAIELTDLASNNFAELSVSNVSSHPSFKAGVLYSLTESSIGYTDGTPGILFTDSKNSKGALYAADYSANFTARSLIDKGYGDAHYAGGIMPTDTAAMLANYIPKFVNSSVPSIKTFSKPLNLATQSTSPGAPGSGIYLYADSINRLSWEKSDGHKRTLKMPYAGNQVAAFELKAAYTLADSADVALKAPLASPLFTGTATLPGMTLAGDILPSAPNTYNLGASGNVMAGVYTNNAQITNLTASNATFGTSGGSDIFIKGTTSGTITLAPQAVAGSYGWYWPTTHGAVGSFLTSDGGVGTGQTWTDITNYAFGSPTATTVSPLTNSTIVATTAYTDAAVAATATYFAASFLAGAGTSGSPYDFNYARSGTYTADQIISLSSLAATQTNGFELVTPTASTSGATVENSPALHFGAHVWKSGGTAADRWSDFMILNEPTTGTTPTGNLNIYASVSTTGTPSYSLVGSFGSNGNWSIQGNLFANIFSSIGQINHLVGGSGSLTQVAGTGAGTSPTITLTGNDLALKVAVTTGTSPTGSNAIVSTITFNSTFASAPRVILVAANAAAAGLSGANEAFVNDASTTTAHFVIESGSTALAASTAYIWYAYIIQ